MAKKILAALHKLNPTHEIRTDILERILYINDILTGSMSPEIQSPKSKVSSLACNLNTVEKEIATIQESVKDLQKKFDTIHSTTIIALVHAGVHVEKFERFFNTTAEEIDKAKEAVRQLKKDYPEWISKKWGRPKKEGALHIAEILADEYYRATGKIPTFSNRLIQINPHQKGYKKYGEFLDLVQSVFDALEVKARPEAIAREANNLWRKRKSIIDAKHKLAVEAKEKNPLKRRTKLL